MILKRQIYEISANWVQMFLCITFENIVLIYAINFLVLVICYE